MYLYRDRGRRTTHFDFYKLISLLNVLILIGTIFYIIYGTAEPAWNIFGQALLLILIINLLISFKSRGNLISYVYCTISFFFMLIIPFINMGASLYPGNITSLSPWPFVTIILLLLTGSVQAAQISPEKRSYGLNTYYQRRSSLLSRILKKIPLLIIILILTGMTVITIMVFRTGKDLFTEVVAAQISMFAALAILSLGIMILKTLKEKDAIVLKTIVTVITIFGFTAGLIPFVSTPVTAGRALKEYRKAYPPVSINERGMRNTMFSIPEYIFGTRSEEYLLEENLVYYEEDGLTLKYDVYMPVSNPTENPLPVLIRVHGGGWTIGDKGSSNFAQMNKYFAACGYAVFDIQYGISNKDKFIEYVKIEPERSGDYSIDDMVGHIGIFSEYLVENSKNYNIDIGTVFFSGGSAGGQLILAAVLGEAISSDITVKGIIPFYPAAGLARNLGIEGRDEYIDPVVLVNENSPPCLIYHGKNDGLVSIDISHDIKNEYEKYGGNCALMSMPYAGHGSDLYFSGSYNQIFIYFMERFMMQYR